MPRFSEAEITKAIVGSAMRQWLELAEVDVAIAGAGPAGLTAAIYLAERGFKTVVFERRLSFGGGIGGGGMLFPRVVVQSPADEVLDKIGCRKEESSKGLYVVNPAEFISKLASAAVDAGATILLGATVIDVVFRKNPLRICGVVLQWSAVELAGLHVDPIAVCSKAVLDCTGHDAEVVAVAARKLPELGLKVVGEGAMFAWEGERYVVENAGRVCPGLYVAGMSVSSVHGTPRMGPIFGGMLLSAKRVAEAVAQDLSQAR